MNKKTRLLLIPNGGLCNRMRAVASGLNLARRTNGSTKILWMISGELGAAFEEVFQPISCGLHAVPVEVENMRMNRIKGYFWTRMKPVVIRFCALAGWRWFSDFKESDFKKVGVARFADEKSIVESCYSFLPCEKDDITIGEIFKFRKKIIDRAVGLANDGMIGIHIRRSDNVQAIQESPLELFEEAIAEKLKGNPKQRFFLATDDEDTARRLKSKFDGAIAMQERRNLKRGEDAGIVDAAVDFLALSRCHEILGSYWSSFSDIAAEYGKRPLTILKK